jgi:meso-butanediol dehydrogenase / (S,S)-butanediol dehydrogenase / diacetyl reductase
MTRRLQDKVALVTGGAAGIGAGIVRSFVTEAARVAIGDVDSQPGSALAEELGEDARFQSLDVADEDSFAAAIESTVEHWGRLDVLVNNAGIVFPATPVQDTSTEDFERLVSVNIRGTYLGCRLAFPHLLDTRGCVLNVSSLVGIVGEKSHAVYGATKGAINALTRCVAADWRERGMRINALCPSDVWTDALQGWCEAQPDPSFLDHYEKMRAKGYCAEPEEIGRIAAFLCSDEARFINGAVLPASYAAECGYEI